MSNCSVGADGGRRARIACRNCHIGVFAAIGIDNVRGRPRPANDVISAVTVRRLGVGEVSQLVAFAGSPVVWAVATAMSLVSDLEDACGD